MLCCSHTSWRCCREAPARDAGGRSDVGWGGLRGKRGGVLLDGGGVGLGGAVMTDRERASWWFGVVVGAMAGAVGLTLLAWVGGGAC